MSHCSLVKCKIMKWVFMYCVPLVNFQQYGFFLSWKPGNNNQEFHQSWFLGTLMIVFYVVLEDFYWYIFFSFIETTT